MSDPRLVTLWLIAEDAYNDTMAMEGQLFTGKVVAEHLGYMRAQIMHLARILAEVIKEHRQ